MALFLSVLKIIGIVLLVILLLILLNILLILFVPVRYRADAFIEETDLEKDSDKLKDNIKVDAQFSWLFRIVRSGISYPDETEFYVKVLCFKVFPPKNKKIDELSDELDYEAADDSETIAETEKESGFEDSGKAENAEGSEEGNATGEEDLTEEETGEDSQDSAEDGTEEGDSVGEEDDFEDDEDEGFLKVLSDIGNTIVKIIKVPQDVFAKIQYTISRIYGKINMVKNTLSNDIFKRAFAITKKHVIKVLKMIKPRKIKANVLIGLEDPSVVADIMAAYGMFYPLVAGKVYIVPDFNRQVLAGESHIKGRITVFRLLLSAAILYFNKDVRKTCRRLKKIIDS